MISITLYQPSVIIILEKRGSNMIRLRRLRGSEAIRNMVRENRVNKEDLVYPMFVAVWSGVLKIKPSSHCRR